MLHIRIFGGITGARDLSRRGDLATGFNSVLISLKKLNGGARSCPANVRFQFWPVPVRRVPVLASYGSGRFRFWLVLVTSGSGRFQFPVPVPVLRFHGEYLDPREIPGIPGVP